MQMVMFFLPFSSAVQYLLQIYADGEQPTVEEKPLWRKIGAPSLEGENGFGEELMSQPKEMPPLLPGQQGAGS